MIKNAAIPDGLVCESCKSKPATTHVHQTYFYCNDCSGKQAKVASEIKSAAGIPINCKAD
jgi:Zn finger protein HypA/HybF involved in hydrogenase expression